jgi:hypothetical protein
MTLVCHANYYTMQKKLAGKSMAMSRSLIPRVAFRIMYIHILYILYCTKMHTYVHYILYLFYIIHYIYMYQHQDMKKGMHTCGTVVHMHTCHVNVIMHKYALHIYFNKHHTLHSKFDVLDVHAPTPPLSFH